MRVQSIVDVAISNLIFISTTIRDDWIESSQKFLRESWSDDETKLLRGILIQIQVGDWTPGVPSGASDFWSHDPPYSLFAISIIHLVVLYILGNF